jgi:methionyl-tRNA synthetase
MLHAMGFPDDKMPQLLVHGWWNLAGAKMSKSTGNIVDPFVLADTYGAEALRYYLMGDIAIGQDADFSEERLVQRYNTDLANSLGNLLNRTLNMTHRYRDGLVKRAGGDPPLAAQATDLLREYESAMSRFEVHSAMSRLVEFATTCNTYIEMSAPWKLAKDPDRSEALDHVLFALAESLRIIAILISPVLPVAARETFYQLNLRDEYKLSDAQWGGLPDKHHLGKPVPLFPRIETMISG